MTTDPELSKKIDGLSTTVESLKQTMADLQRQIEEVGRRAGNFQQLGGVPTPQKDFSIPAGAFFKATPNTPCLREGKSLQDSMMLYCGCNKCSPHSLTLNIGVPPPNNTTQFFEFGADGQIKPKETNGKDQA